MTAKEKAKELFDKMEKDFQYFASREVAKQHALIAVDEIIKAMDNVMLPNPFKQYWNKVKQEIQAL
jgi:hypothetical protein